MHDSKHRGYRDHHSKERVQNTKDRKRTHAYFPALAEGGGPETLDCPAPRAHPVYLRYLELRYRSEFQPSVRRDRCPSTIEAPDAIHLATAILYDVDEMHTMDGWHADGKRDGLLALSGNVAEYKLLITEPYPRGTPPVPSSTPPERLTGEQEFLWKDVLEEELESEGDQRNAAIEENNKLETDPTHPASVQGSDSGRAQGETAGERTKKDADH